MPLCVRTAAIAAALVVAVSGGAQRACAQSAQADSAGGIRAATLVLGARDNARGVIAQPERDRASRLDAKVAPAGVFDDVSAMGVLLTAVLVVAVVYVVSRSVAH
jgi:hypothetical protein